MTGSTHCPIFTECTFCALPWNGQSETLGRGGRQLPTAERPQAQKLALGFWGPWLGLHVEPAGAGAPVWW